MHLLQQKDKDYFSICVTHSHSTKPKLLSKFYGTGLTRTNSVMVDSRPESWAANIKDGNFIPIHSFEKKNDSTLLFLQKYLQEIQKEDDLSETISCDFERILNPLTPNIFGESGGTVQWGFGVA